MFHHNCQEKNTSQRNLMVLDTLDGEETFLNMFSALSTCVKSKTKGKEFSSGGGGANYFPLKFKPFPWGKSIQKGEQEANNVVSSVKMAESDQMYLYSLNQRAMFTGLQKTVR